MNKEEFKTIVGREPEDDDLERANCKKSDIGHLFCGICPNCGKPRFECGSTAIDLVNNCGSALVGADAGAKQSCEDCGHGSNRHYDDKLCLVATCHCHRGLSCEELGCICSNNHCFCKQQRKGKP